MLPGLSSATSYRSWIEKVIKRRIGPRVTHQLLWVTSECAELLRSGHVLPGRISFKWWVGWNRINTLYLLKSETAALAKIQEKNSKLLWAILYQYSYTTQSLKGT